MTEIMKLVKNVYKRLTHILLVYYKDLCQNLMKIRILQKWNK